MTAAILPTIAFPCCSVEKPKLGIASPFVIARVIAHPHSYASASLTTGTRGATSMDSIRRRWHQQRASDE